MNKSNKAPKTPKTAKTAAPAEVTRNDSERLTARAALLHDVSAERAAQIASAESSDVAEKLRLSAINATHRAQRATAFAKLFDGDARCADTFVTLAETAARIAEFDALAIYTQDKIKSLIRALTYSTIETNARNRDALRTLAAGSNGATRADVIAAMMNAGKSAGTAGSQASSSLIALTFCRLASSDGAGRFARYTLADRDAALRLVA